MILVDDGSRDAASATLLDALEADPKWLAAGWRVVRTRNRYLGAARNTGARLASGKYVMFMDDDDYAKPNQVAVFVSVAETTGARVVTTGHDLFTGLQPPSESSAVGRYVPLGAAPKVGLLVNCFGDSNMLVDRQQFLTGGGFTEEAGLGFEDYEFLAAAVLNGTSLETVVEPLHWYRKHGASMSTETDFKANRARVMRVYDRDTDGSVVGLVQRYRRSTDNSTIVDVFDTSTTFEEVFGPNPTQQDLVDAQLATAAALEADLNLPPGSIIVIIGSYATGTARRRAIAEVALSGIVVPVDDEDNTIQRTRRELVYRIRYFIFIIGAINQATWNAQTNSGTDTAVVKKGLPYSSTSTVKDVTLPAEVVQNLENTIEQAISGGNDVAAIREDMVTALEESSLCSASCSELGVPEDWALCTYDGGSPQDDIAYKCWSVDEFFEAASLSLCPLQQLSTLTCVGTTAANRDLCKFNAVSGTICVPASVVGAEFTVTATVDILCGPSTVVTAKINVVNQASAAGCALADDSKAAYMAAGGDPAAVCEYTVPGCSVCSSKQQCATCGRWYIPSPAGTCELCQSQDCFENIYCNGHDWLCPKGAFCSFLGSNCAACDQCQATAKYDVWKERCTKKCPSAGTTAASTTTTTTSTTSITTTTTTKTSATTTTTTACAADSYEPDNTVDTANFASSKSSYQATLLEDDIDFWRFFVLGKATLVAMVTGSGQYRLTVYDNRRIPQRGAVFTQVGTDTRKLTFKSSSKKATSYYVSVQYAPNTAYPVDCRYVITNGNVIVTTTTTTSSSTTSITTTVTPTATTTATSTTSFTGSTTTNSTSSITATTTTSITTTTSFTTTTILTTSATTTAKTATTASMRLISCTKHSQCPSGKYCQKLANRRYVCVSCGECTLRAKTTSERAFCKAICPK